MSQRPITTCLDQYAYACRHGASLEFWRALDGTMEQTVRMLLTLLEPSAYDISEKTCEEVRDRIRELSSARADIRDRIAALETAVTS